MKWEKLGQLYTLRSLTDWMVSHSANPTAEHLYEDVFRIYFSCRDKENRSSISYIDYDIIKQELVAESRVQVLAPGPLGAFDDAGCSIGCIINTIDNKKYLYYMGWHLCVSVPWSNYTGLAVWSESKRIFEKYQFTPIMDRTEIDPYSISYPSIIHEDSVYKMWYGSNLSWGREKQEMNHVIKYAESKDGIKWDTTGHVCIQGKDESEYAFARTCVLLDGDGVYKMWYSYRGSTYRIGYAESGDGLKWIRMDDQVGIDVSNSGWDSEMIEYPFVFDHKDKRYMLYAGNSFGKTGFGLAVLV